MTPQEFGKLSKFLKESSGLHVGEEKTTMLEGRLRPVMQEFSIPSISALLEAMNGPASEDLRESVAQAATVQESYFFRDSTPFDYFAEKMLPALMLTRAKTKRIRIWCCAAATGQEPYSLAMKLRELGDKLEGWRIDLVATDFAEDALRKARVGIYTQFEVQRGLPVFLLLKYFRRLGGPWQIKEEVRDMVRFRRQNLLADFRSLGIFDIVFCRNVLIYFDEATKRDVLKRLSAQIAGDGYFVVGAAETTIGLCDEFKAAAPDLHGIYSLRLQPLAQTA